jgi:hypothetical protein
MFSILHDILKYNCTPSASTDCFRYLVSKPRKNVLPLKDTEIVLRHFEVEWGVYGFEAPRLEVQPRS